PVQPQMTNAERARELLQLAGAMQIEQLIDLLAEAAVLELPFAPGRMQKTYEGRAAISDFLVATRAQFSAFSMTIDAVHPTVEPRIVIAEHHSDAVVGDNGRPYGNRYVTIFSFDAAGRVMNWREYFDAGVLVRAFGASRDDRGNSRSA